MWKRKAEQSTRALPPNDSLPWVVYHVCNVVSTYFATKNPSISVRFRQIFVKTEPAQAPVHGKYVAVFLCYTILYEQISNFVDYFLIVDCDVKGRGLNAEGSCFYFEYRIAIVDWLVSFR